MHLKNKVFFTIIIVLALVGIVAAVLSWSKYYKEQQAKEKIQEMCKDVCGDEICQRIVCLGPGCPCVETVERCPQDCQ